MRDLKKIRQNNYFKTIIAIVLIVAIILVLFFGLQFGLKTSNPMLTVESGSMSIPYDSLESQTWQGFWLSITHPFDRTLSVGDIIIVQGVTSKDLNANYPNSDIIVYHNPDNPSELIVHRIVSEEIINGTIYFQTKGDGNPPEVWPNPATQVDPWGPIPQSDVVGKVVMRIPWFGWITLEMKNNHWALPLVIALILLLVIIEFVIPTIKERKSNQHVGKKLQSGTS